MRRAKTRAKPKVPELEALATELETLMKKVLFTGQLSDEAVDDNKLSLHDLMSTVVTKLAAAKSLADGGIKSEDSDTVDAGLKLQLRVLEAAKANNLVANNWVANRSVANGTVAQVEALRAETGGNLAVALADVQSTVKIRANGSGEKELLKRCGATYQGFPDINADGLKRWAKETPGEYQARVSGREAAGPSSGAPTSAPLRPRAAAAVALSDEDAVGHLKALTKEILEAAKEIRGAAGELRALIQVEADTVAELERKLRGLHEKILDMSTYANTLGERSDRDVENARVQLRVATAEAAVVCTSTAALICASGKSNEMGRPNIEALEGNLEGVVKAAVADVSNIEADESKQVARLAALGCSTMPVLQARADASVKTMMEAYEADVANQGQATPAHGAEVARPNGTSISARAQGGGAASSSSSAGGATPPAGTAGDGLLQGAPAPRLEELRGLRDEAGKMVVLARAQNEKYEAHSGEVNSSDFIATLSTLKGAAEELTSNADACNTSTDADVCDERRRLRVNAVFAAQSYTQCLLNLGKKGKYQENLGDAIKVLKETVQKGREDCYKVSHSGTVDDQLGRLTSGDTRETKERLERRFKEAEETIKEAAEVAEAERKKREGSLGLAERMKRNVLGCNMDGAKFNEFVEVNLVSLQNKWGTYIGTTQQPAQAVNIKIKQDKESITISDGDDANPLKLKKMHKAGEKGALCFLPQNDDTGWEPMEQAAALFFLREFVRNDKDERDKKGQKKGRLFVTLPSSLFTEDIDDSRIWTKEKIKALAKAIEDLDMWGDIKPKQKEALEAIIAKQGLDNADKLKMGAAESAGVSDDGSSSPALAAAGAGGSDGRPAGAGDEGASEPRAAGESSDDGSSSTPGAPRPAAEVGRQSGGSAGGGDDGSSSPRAPAAAESVVVVGEGQPRRRRRRISREGEPGGGSPDAPLASALPGPLEKCFSCFGGSSVGGREPQGAAGGGLFSGETQPPTAPRRPTGAAMQDGANEAEAQPSSARPGSSGSSSD